MLCLTVFIAHILKRWIGGPNPDVDDAAKEEEKGEKGGSLLPAPEDQESSPKEDLASEVLFSVGQLEAQRTESPPDSPTPVAKLRDKHRQRLVTRRSEARMKACQRNIGFKTSRRLLLAAPL